MNQHDLDNAMAGDYVMGLLEEIGRASCRERV